MGVITMKMISSTSMTSTIGVTLMSEVTFAILFSAFDICLPISGAVNYRRALRRFKK
jgi:hypothetical protein